MAEYASNSKANFDYEILETIEAGIVLEGHEVKAIKTGKASIKGSYVKIINNEIFLIGATIAPYQIANTPKDYDPQRSRKLLLAQTEISKLITNSKTERTTFVPLRIYDKPKNGKIKLLIGVAVGKKKYDKRETIKKKDLARARQRGLE